MREDEEKRKKERARRVNKEGNTRILRLLRLYLTSVSFLADGQKWMDILERLTGKNYEEENVGEMLGEETLLRK